MEVVLPAPYYAILVVEALGLAALHFVRPEDSGGAPLSHLLGWAGTLSMCLMHVYSIRRRVRALRHFGPLRSWLHFHIFMGLQGALLVTYHSSHLHTLSNLSGVNIALTLVVVSSGIFGRYLFAMIPKGLSGERLGAHQIEEELGGLAERLKDGAPSPELAAAVASYAEGPRLTKMRFGELVKEDLRSRRALAELERTVRAAATRKVEAASLADILKVDEFLALARRRVLLARRLMTLQTADRMFGYWTVLHKPLTFLLLGSTLLHVFSHYLFGAGMYSK